MRVSKQISWAIFVIVQILDLTSCEVAYIYPGLRRKPTYGSLQEIDISPDILAQLVEEHARRRLQQQIEQQLEAIHIQMSHKPEINDFKHLLHDKNTYKGHTDALDFEYNFPRNPSSMQFKNGNDVIEFAVNPSDPRFKLEDYFFDDKSQYNQRLNEFKPLADNSDQEDSTYFKFKGAFDKNSVKSVEYENNLKKDENIALRKFFNKNNAEGLDGNSVVKDPLSIEAEIGIYIVALIAGISAAVTVGLIALGIAWYTLQKKAKAAADIEYPAYGITGPNKDVSPSLDKRLAQSAQMYHYQHQKQQIIAMQQQNEGNPGPLLSDVESDDDNEEGDYTVYECPGLAPTGEMEVKNPLFLDDTPISTSTKTLNTE